MSDLLQQIEAARVRAAEDAVIASLPPDLLENLDRANANFAARGGCPGCKSTLIGVHHWPCSKLGQSDFD